MSNSISKIRTMLAREYSTTELYYLLNRLGLLQDFLMSHDTHIETLFLKEHLRCTPLGHLREALTAQREDRPADFARHYARGNADSYDVTSLFSYSSIEGNTFSDNIYSTIVKELHNYGTVRYIHKGKETSDWITNIKAMNMEVDEVRFQFKDDIILDHINKTIQWSMFANTYLLATIQVMFPHYITIGLPCTTLKFTPHNQLSDTPNTVSVDQVSHYIHADNTNQNTAQQ